MTFLMRFFRLLWRGLWSLLTRGLQLGWAWAREGFFHFLAGGAVSGSTRILESARERASSMGVRGTTGSVAFSDGQSPSTSVARPTVRTSEFMSQFI